MTEPAKHIGVGMNPAPEFLVRQILLEGFVDARNDRLMLDEVFGRVDTMDQGSQNQWLIDLRKAFQRMADLGGSGGIDIGLGYPNDNARWPYVSIVMEAGREDTSQATFGDVLSVDYEVIGDISQTDSTTSKSYQHTVIGSEWATTLQVGSWTTVPEESLMLHAMVNALLFRHKRRLEEAGVREIDFSESGFQPEERYIQRGVGYVPVLRAALQWTRRQTLVEGPVPRYFTLNTPTYTNEDL